MALGKSVCEMHKCKFIQYCKLKCRKKKNDAWIMQKYAATIKALMPAWMSLCLRWAGLWWYPRALCGSLCCYTLLPVKIALQRQRVAQSASPRELRVRDACQHNAQEREEGAEGRRHTNTHTDTQPSSGAHYSDISTRSSKRGLRFCKTIYQTILRAYAFRNLPFLLFFIFISK